MFTLTGNEQSNYIEYKGRKIELDLTLNNVLLVFELQKEEFSDAEKIILSFELLSKCSEKYIDVFDIYDLVEIVGMMFEKLSSKAVEKNNIDSDENIIAYDFNYDAEKIYASFLQEYNIDLIEERYDLDWFKFIALFQNLGDKTPMMQAIYYRVCDLPEGKEYADERKRIKKLKEHYELPEAKEKREKSEIEKLMKAVERM